jgi:RES domain-containing protein
VTAQVLDRVLVCYRIGDPKGEHPIYSSAGSKLFPGRWNGAEHPVIYASEHYSTAMLEKLVHGSGRIPPNQHFVEIVIPPGTSYEVVTKDTIPDWAAADCAAARAHGVEWRNQSRSAILIVPSVAARMENNVVINDEHDDARRIATGLHQPVWWDSRLFQN